MLSIHEGSALGQVRSHPSHGWTTVDTTDLHLVAELACRYSWAPAIFKTGHRCIEEFCGADFIGLDFDASLPLAEAQVEFAEYQHVIGTTHNHGKPKGDQGPGDRFRVILRLERHVTDPQEFRATMEALRERYPLDESTVDPARLYYRCINIVSVRDSGKTVAICEPKPRREIKTLPPSRSRVLTPFVRTMLTEYVPRGKRTVHLCWRVATDLFRSGYTVEEIEYIIANSKTYRTDGIDEDARHGLRNAIRSAAKRNGIDIPKTYWRGAEK